MLIVAVLPSIVFPPKRPVGRTGGEGAPADSTAAPAGAQRESAAALVPPPVREPAAPSAAVSAETVWVTSPAYRLGFSTRGASLVSAELLENRSFSAADSGRPVQLVPAGRPRLRYPFTPRGDPGARAAPSLPPGAPRRRLGAGRG